MAAEDQCKLQRLQGGLVTNIITGHQFAFNSTQQTAVEAATTAATSSLAGAITAINTLGGLFNDVKTRLVNLGVLAST